MKDKNIVIQLKNVSKKFMILYEKDALIRYLLPKKFKIRREEFYPLKNIDLTLRKGNSLGVLGRNGAGKTTLLNLIAGVTSPIEGERIVEGKISYLSNLGAGFHSELNGIENIFVNALILGLKKKEIVERLNSILDFSELGDFITVPLLKYSSGMIARLAFAIAMHVDFDILLLDEVFSVGDIGFQKKCLKKMKMFRSQGKSIVLVSQSLDLIEEFCDEAILMNNGRIVYRGLSKDVIDQYQEILDLSKDVNGDGTMEYRNQSYDIKRPQESDESEALSVSNGGVRAEPLNTIINFKQESQEINRLAQYAKITKVRFIGAKQIEKCVFATGESMQILVDYIVNKEICDPHFGVAIFRDNGIYCYGPNTKLDGIKIDKLRIGKGQFSIEYKFLDLLPGKYLVSVAIWDNDEKFAYDYHYIRYSFEVASQKNDHGVFFMEHKWRFNLIK